MPYQKANEAYFADVFSRTPLAYCSSVDWLPSDAVKAEAAAYDIAPDYDHTVIASKGINGSVSCVIDDIKDDIGAILARLAALESQLAKKNACDNLRSALKTLNYTREL